MEAPTSCPICRGHLGNHPPDVAGYLDGERVEVLLSCADCGKSWTPKRGSDELIEVTDVSFPEDYLPSS